MDFTKMHGAANDFVVVDGRNIQRDWSKLAISVCNRHLGIGCDSLVVLLPSGKADFGMRTFDTDGSEAETCGNGIRCLARYVLEKGLIAPDAEEITIETLTNVNRVWFEKTGGRITKFWTNMGKPQLSADKIPVLVRPGDVNAADINGMISYQAQANGNKLTLNLISMGNPHAVCFSTEPVADFPMEKLGPIVENLPVFPNRMNFEVARVIDNQHIEARVWERGVGETMACGSGTCAIIVASRIQGLTASRVDIKLPGGTLNAELNEDGEVIIGGPAEVVFEGKWPD